MATKHNQPDPARVARGITGFHNCLQYYVYKLYLSGSIFATAVLSARASYASATRGGRDHPRALHRPDPGGTGNLWGVSVRGWNTIGRGCAQR